MGKRKRRTDNSVNATDIFHPQWDEVKSLVHQLCQIGHLTVSCGNTGDRFQVSRCTGSDTASTIVDDVRAVTLSVDQVVHAYRLEFQVHPHCKPAFRQLARSYHPESERYEHAPASNRSHCFALKAASIYRLGSEDKIVTLDARLRNCIAITNHTFIPAASIVLVERHPIVAMYQQVLALLLYPNPRSRPTIVYGDVVDYIKSTGANVVALYLDLCGMIPVGVRQVFVQDRLPRLRLYAATIGKRKVASDRYEAHVFPPSNEWLLGQAFFHRQVDCNFYFHPDVPPSVRDCGDLPFLADRVVDLEVDELDARRYRANVIWYWYPKGHNNRWSQTLEPASEHRALVQEYLEAKKLFPLAYDPVRMLRDNADTPPLHAKKQKTVNV